MKHIVKNLFFLLTFSLLGAGTMDATTAAKGVFTVAAGKTVQFANAKVATREATQNLYKWKEAVAMQADGWTLLSEAEWSYLLADGRTNAANLNNLGTVNSQNGLIILPDGWVQPSGVPAFKPVGQGIAFDKNVYTAEQWAVMANAGAVFLPCGGYGYNDAEDGNKYKVADVTSHGTFWTSTASTGTKAYCMRFYNATIHDQNFDPDTTTYRSVILVREVTVLDEEDESSAFATKLGAADDKDFALVRRTLKKDGTLYTLCLPFDVPNIDNSPLAGAEVYTFNGGTVGGSTGSEVLHLSLSRLTGKRLTQGVPYLLRWENTGETLTKPLYFENVENWDDDTNAATDPGNATVKMHGVYPKAHIPGYETPEEAHYNFFLGANNTLYWPDDSGNEGEWASHMMKGFRAYFYTSGGGPSPAPLYRNMPTVWEIEGVLGSTTSVEGIQPSAVSVQKELREGQIILIIDGEMYDLMGRKIKD